MYRYALERISIPNPSLKILVRLGKTLVEDKPEQTNEVIELAAARLLACIAEVMTAITARHRETNPEIIATEVELDRSADTLWIWLRKLLEGWATALGHAGLEALSKELAEKVGLPALREKAELSRKLHERLFGAEGTRWTQRPFIEQVESMDALLRLIAEDELGEDLQKIVGPELPVLLAAVQEQYEAMVSERMRRSGSLNDDFRELRAKLRWKIDRYVNAVETLRDDEDPASDEIVDKALASLILLNQRMRAGGGAAEDDELLGEGLVDLEAPQEQDAEEVDPEASE